MARIFFAGHDVDDARRDAGLQRGLLPHASAESGVSSAGLTTIVQPAASAGPSFRVIVAAGKFHGVMHTPVARDGLPENENALLSESDAEGPFRRRPAWPLRRPTR